MGYALSAVLGLCFFMLPMWAYRKGLKDGLAVGQGKAMEPIKTPVKIIQEHREAKQAKEEQDLFRDGLANILAYEGIAQKVGDK